MIQTENPLNWRQRNERHTPLDNDEIRRGSGTFEIRNRGLFTIGVSAGGRISELLNLRIKNVYQNKKPVTDLLFDKSIVKCKEVSRAVPVNNDGRLAIAELVNWYRDRYGDVDEKRPLFPSRNGKGQTPMSRRTAHDVLKMPSSPQDSTDTWRHIPCGNHSPNGFTIAPVIFSLCKRCWGIATSRRRRSISV